MSEDEQLYNRFILAFPELRFNLKFMEFAVKRGIVSKEELDHFKDWDRRMKYGTRLSKAISGGTLLERILAVAPEVMSVSTVNFMLEGGLLGDMSTSAGRKEATLKANALRAVFSGAKALKPVFSRDATVLARLEAVYGAGTSSYIINFLRDVDDARIADLRNSALLSRGGKRLTAEESSVFRNMVIASIQKAHGLRSYISTAKIIKATAEETKAAHNVMGAVSIVMKEILGNSKGDKLIKNAIRAGVISDSQFDLYSALRRLGYTAWSRGEKTFSYEGWQARALLVAEGVFSPEMINALRAAGYMPAWLARRLYPAVTAIRKITRKSLNEYIKDARYRVGPGENPIQTFARISQTSDRALLGLLQEAAEEAQRVANAAMSKGTFSGKARAAQQRIVANEVNGVMRELWENSGHLIIFGEKQAAAAALESVDYLHGSVWRKPPKQYESIIRAAKEQGRAGANAYISRQENIVQLSRRVYNNTALASGLVEREINKALIRGVSAQELAASVRSMINPSVRGGVSYSAMRLARTEINNAFHYEQIRYTREQPWVSGYKWQLSGSHPKGQKGDPCADMASRNHDGLGRGIYRKANVPGKPHPQCLCFLTNVMMDNKTFDARLRSGAFDDYLNAAVKDHKPNPPGYSQDLSVLKKEIVAVSSAVALAKLTK